MTTLFVQKVKVASGHTATNTPDLFRTPKLTVAGPGQYWGGGPPGKPFGCCWLFEFAADDYKAKKINLAENFLIASSSTYCHIFGAV